MKKKSMAAMTYFIASGWALYTLWTPVKLCKIFLYFSCRHWERHVITEIKKRQSPTTLIVILHFIHISIIGLITSLEIGREDP